MIWEATFRPKYAELDELLEETKDYKAFLSKVVGIGSLISLKAVTDKKIFYLNQTAVHL
jgi:hypothetical protein